MRPLEACSYGVFIGFFGRSIWERDHNVLECLIKGLREVEGLLEKAEYRVNAIHCNTKQGSRTHLPTSCYAAVFHPS